MKLRWHLLFIALGILAAILFGYTPRQPLWRFDDSRIVRYAGFDPVRREWCTLSSTTEKTDWEVETRAGISWEVVRRVKLELPMLSGDYQSLRIFHDQPNAIFVVRDSRQESNDRRMMPTKTNLWLLDPATGKMLRHSPLRNSGIGYSIAIHGSRIAMLESGWVKLFDGDTLRERDFQVHAGDDIKFSTDGSLLVCTDSSREKLISIDWNTTARSQQSLGVTVRSFHFISADVLLIREGNTVSRWKWNGKEYDRISPGVVISYFGLLLSRKHPGGLLQLLASNSFEWPLPMKPCLEWLESKGIPVSKWYPKTRQARWYLVDDQDRVVSEINEPLSQTKIAVYDQFAVEFQPQFSQGKSILFWNTSPIWPNAMALGMMVYLMLYVAVLCFNKNACTSSK